MQALKIALVASVALATAAPAFAQYQPTQQYQRDMREYNNQQADYASQQADYASRQAEYQRARDDYEGRRDRYERDRERYDRRYGVGAYARINGPAPAWDDNYWNDRYRSVSWSSRDDFDRRAAQYDRDRATYDRRNGRGAYERRYGPPPAWNANDNGRDVAYTGAYNDPCRGKKTTNTVAGGLIGALAGAALGSNVAARNARTEGAVLGAVVGGALGANIGKSTAKCDNTGYYYSYDQTIPYQESDYDRRSRSGRYDYTYYNNQRCRLAPAPIDNNGQDYRYVRVCPDGEGRYRITG